MVVELRFQKTKYCLVLFIVRTLHAALLALARKQRVGKGKTAARPGTTGPTPSELLLAWKKSQEANKHPDSWLFAPICGRLNYLDICLVFRHAMTVVS
jgi:hypothetical protein